MKNLSRREAMGTIITAGAGVTLAGMTQAAARARYVRACVSHGLRRGGGEVRRRIQAKRQLSRGQSPLHWRAESCGGIALRSIDEKITVYSRTARPCLTDPPARAGAGGEAAA